MELIRQNPYHVVGILAGANQRTIARQKAKIKAFQKVGKSIEFDTDLEFMGKPDRSNGAIEKAFSNIEINQDKLFNALFWFTDHNHLDETALNYLQAGDLEKAEDIWQKVTNGKEISSKNFSAFSNLGTLKLMKAFANGSIDSGIMKEGIRLKTELLTSDYFNDFCHLVADETYSIDKDKELEIFVNALIEEVDKLKSSESKKIPAQIGSIHPKLKSIISEKLTDEPIHNIERKVKQTKKRRNKNPENGFQFARKLYRDTKIDLSKLSEILGETDLQYKMVADKLAKEILQCGIDYYMDLQKRYENIDNKKLDSVIHVFEYSLSVSVGDQTTERIKENLRAVNEIKNREVYILINMLDQIIEAYDNSGDIVGPGQIRKVDNKKVIGFLKDNLTDNILQKVAQIDDKAILTEIVNKIEKVFSNIGRTQYTYSKVKYLSDLLSHNEVISKRLEDLASKIKPNVTSVASSVNDATGGYFFAIGMWLILMITLATIVALLAEIFGNK